MEEMGLAYLALFAIVPNPPKVNASTAEMVVKINSFIIFVDVALRLVYVWLEEVGFMSCKIRLLDV